MILPRVGRMSGRNQSNFLVHLLISPMLIIPQQLFEQPNVHTLLRSGNTAVLVKSLSEPVYEREGYVSSHVVSMVLDGEQRIYTPNDRQVRVQAGELLLIPRGLYQISDLLPVSGEPFRSLLFYFEDEIVHEFLDQSEHNPTERSAPFELLRLPPHPTLRQFADTTLTVYQTNCCGSKVLVRLKILELLHLIDQLCGPQRLTESLFNLTLPRRRSLRQFMERNFNKPLKIKDFAYLTGRSVSSFRRDFKEQFATTPNQWLKQRRLDHATELLRHNSDPVESIALSAGFKNASYFVQEFRKREGRSPGRFRAELK